MHLSYTELATYYRLRNLNNNYWKFNANVDLNSNVFYSVPISFFRNR